MKGNITFEKGKLMWLQTLVEDVLTRETLRRAEAMNIDVQNFTVTDISVYPHERCVSVEYRCDGRSHGDWEEYTLAEVLALCIHPSDEEAP